MTVTNEFFMPPPAGARDAVTDSWVARAVELAKAADNWPESRPQGISELLELRNHVLSYGTLTGKADGTHVFNCRRCPVSVVSRWLEPTCPECGDPTELDATAKPQRIELCELHGSQYVRGCAYCTGDLDTLEATQPAATGAGDGLERFLIQNLLKYMTIVDDRNDVWSHWQGVRVSVKQLAAEYLGDTK